MLRRLGTGDASAFRHLRLRALASHQSAFGADYSDEARQPLEFFEKRLVETHVFGAFDDNDLVGVIGLRRDIGRKTKHNALIWGVYLDPAYRGRGLADELLQAAIAEARELGASWLKLAVSSDNAPARRLYERHGFVAYGREPGALQLDGTDYDEDLMAFKL